MTKSLHIFFEIKLGFLTCYLNTYLDTKCMLSVLQLAVLLNRAVTLHAFGLLLILSFGFLWFFCLPSHSHLLPLNVGGCFQFCPWSEVALPCPPGHSAPSTPLLTLISSGRKKPWQQTVVHCRCCTWWSHVQRARHIQSQTTSSSALSKLIFLPVWSVINSILKTLPGLFTCS